METNAIDDKEILAGLSQPSTRQQASQLLLKKYAPKLYYFLRHLGLDHDDADEQVQEILVRFWRKLNGLKEHDRLDTALYSTAVEICFIFLRKHGEFIMGGLSPEQKVVFTLKQQEDFDYHEMAVITGLPLNQVREHFRLALNNIIVDKNRA